MPNSLVMDDLFAALEPPLPAGVTLQRGLFGPPAQAELTAAVGKVAARAPIRHPQTRRRGTFSAAITNCGIVGWWSDHAGYRYIETQPKGGGPWPAMPEVFLSAVKRAVAASPWPGFTPDACLINFYGPGAKMGLHQDKDERDFAQPIVTISLGDAADFMVGGNVRAAKPVVFPFRSGDVLIMGAPSRMRFHGVRKVHAGTSPIADVLGRYSLTFRKAL